MKTLTSESRTLLYVLISSLLSFRRVNIRYLELNIPQECNVFLIFREQELRVCIFTIREKASFVMFSIAVQVLFMRAHSFWCHLVNGNDCSKTVFKYSDFLSLELKNVVGILECVLPELNIEESRLLAILLDGNSKHTGKAQRLLTEMCMRNSDGASSCKTDFFETRKG